MLSILITHYNRPSALKKCINALRNYNFNLDYEIIISDDGSDLAILKSIESLAYDKLITTHINKGLANNINKGINACAGDYLLYVQEDFIIDKNFIEVFEEGLKLLKTNKLDMIRYRANYKFNKLIPCSKSIYEIPKFSIKNFNINTFRYSDHPFLTTPNFYKKYGYYLEGTSVGYGETEFAIRIMNSKAKIGITKENYFHNIDVESTLGDFSNKQKSKLSKKIKRFARAIRQHVEWILYRPNNRKLYTYTNNRKSGINSKSKL